MAGSKTAVIAALIGNFIIAILKLVAGLIANSSAMLAESAHSFSDTGNQILLLVGIKRSAAPPTADRPYGGAKSAYFWPLMVAVLLFGVAGAYSVIEGVEKIRHPHPLEDIRLALGVLGAAFVIDAVPLVIAIRQARAMSRRLGVTGVRGFLEENRDATILTVLVEDGLALIGVTVAAIALLVARATGNPVWDGIGSLVIGALLMGFALFLAWEVKELIIGRGLGKQDLRTVHRVLDEDPAVERVLNVRSIYFAPEVVLLGAEIDVPDAITGPEVESAVARIERALVAALPQLKYVYVEPRAKATGPALAKRAVRPHRAHEEE